MNIKQAGGVAAHWDRGRASAASWIISHDYDTLVFFNTNLGIQAGPFTLPSTGPAFIKASEKRGSSFYVEGSANKAGCAYYVSRLEPDLSVIRISRSSANAIPRNPAVLSQVDDINNNVGFWAAQSDFRVVERISPGYATFPDVELEAIYVDRVRDFIDYQKRLALHAISRVPNADLVMIYFEQPDGSGHHFFLTDTRQPTDFSNLNSIGAGQDPAKVARYAEYLQFAYQTANAAVQAVIEAVGTDANGRPNANVIVTSDHGFETFHTAVNMNALLAANGIPSSKVRAVTSGPAVNLYINLQGREPNGTVPRAEYVTLQQQLISLLQNFADMNPAYTLGASNVAVFDKIYPRPLPADVNDPSFGRGTSDFVGQDSGDVYALLTVGYNFDGVQSPVVLRLGDAAPASPAASILSLPNFYGAHGYDPTLPNMSAILYAAGPDIGQGELPLAHNVDLAPTIAAMLSVDTYAAVDGVALPIGPLRLTNAASRKTHGPAGTFDLPFPVSGSPGVEGRKASDTGGHTLVFAFNKPLASGTTLVTSGQGIVAAVQPADNQLVVRLENTSDRQTLALSINVTDIYGGNAPTSFRITLLRGDTDGNGAVDAQDVAAIHEEANAGTAVGPHTFRLDVNVNWKINQSDIAQTRSRRAQAEL